MRNRLFLVAAVLFLSPDVFAQARQDTLRLQTDSLKTLPSSIGLEEVHIHGTVSPVRRSAVSATLTSKQLEMSKGAALGDVLKAIAGVNVLKTGATISKPVIHGLHSNRILILNNGIRLESQQWGTEHAPEVDPFMAESMHVIKGAESVKYGADAIGGVIIVNPPALPVEESTGGEFNLIGANNGRSVISSGMLQGGWAALPGLGWRIQGSVKKAGNIRSADYYLGNTGLRELNYSAALGYRKNKASYEAYFSQFTTTLGVLYSAHVGTIEDIEARIAQGRPLEDYRFTYDLSVPKQDVVHQLFKLKTHFDFNDHRSFNLVYGYQRNHRQEFDFRRGNREALPITDLLLNTHTIDLDFEHRKENGLKRSYGFNGTAQVNNNIPGTLANTFIPNYDSMTAGLFIIQKWVKKAFEWEAGLRYDFKVFDAAGFRYANQDEGEGVAEQYYGGRNDFHNVTGSAGGTWNINHAWKLTSNMGIAWRAPTANELYSNGLHHGAGIYEIGDANLKSEQGYKWINSIKHYNKRFSFQLDAYAQYLNNYIFSEAELDYKQTISGTYPMFRYQQTNASFAGADVMLSYRFIPSLSYKLNGAVVRAKNLSTDKYLPYIPSDRLDHSLRLDLPTGSFKESFLQVGHAFVSRQVRYEAGSDYAAPPPAYHLFNLTAGTKYALHQQEIAINLSVNNLFNKSYKEYMNKFRYYAHDMGRNITLRMAYKF